VEKLRKLESEISHETSVNASTGANAYADLESQPMRLKQEDFDKYSAQQVVQMQRDQLKNQD
jgi:hypothetical protein